MARTMPSPSDNLPKGKIMAETFILPQPEFDADIKKIRLWKPWKWIALAVFLSTLLAGDMLPEALTALGYLVGIILIVNLLYVGGRRLRDRLLWRVRNRIMGSFLFVGLIPILLLAGVISLLGYILAGQLAAGYLQSSIEQLERELSLIGVAVGNRIPPTGKDPVDFQGTATLVLQAHRERFPRLSIREMVRHDDGTLEVLKAYDPDGIVKGLTPLLPERFGTDRTTIDGLVNHKEMTLLVSLSRMIGSTDHFLEVTAPFDEHIEQYLEKERSIYMVMMKSESVTVRQVDGKYEVSTGNDAPQRNPAMEKRVNAMFARRDADSRIKVFWGSPMRMLPWGEGNEKVRPRANAMLAVPFTVLIKEYFATHRQAGRFLLTALYVLLSLLLVTELISILIGITISRRITQSVHDIYLGTKALQKGDLDYQIPVRRHDQLGFVAHSFNQMTSSIGKLLIESAEKKRLENELEIAREVQATLFPKQLPHSRGLSIFGGCEAAQTISGDYYDFIVENETCLHVIVGDISGKGISAALLMANIQAVMRNQLMSFRQESREAMETRMAEVIHQLNQQIYRNSPSEKYATLFLGRYEADTRNFTYCNAGHLPPLLINNGTIRHLEVCGPVVGLLEHTNFSGKTIQLCPGDLLIIYTDGVTEAVNGEDEEYGEHRLSELVNISRLLQPEHIYNLVLERIRQWQGSLKQQDDITMIIAKVE
jgi:phosphoserine phosphatase RsbU/P